MDASLFLSLPLPDSNLVLLTHHTRRNDDLEIKKGRVWRAAAVPPPSLLFALPSFVVVSSTQLPSLFSNSETENK